MAVGVAMQAGPSKTAFTLTHWSVVLRAGLEDTQARRALGTLCSSYWEPVYCYVRAQGRNEHDAQYLTQAFFTRMIERDAFRKALPERGRFRSFLLTALKNFLADDYDRHTALKRGGGQALVSFDVQDLEERYPLEAVDVSAPDKLFDKRWALALLDRTLRRLQQEFALDGKAAQFGEFRHFIVPGAEPRTCAEAAARLGMTEEAVKKAVQRLRARYRAIVRQEVEHTLGSEDELEEELRYLWLCLGD